MSIPNTAKQQNSYFAGLLSHESPSRVSTAILDYALDTDVENYATPSRACTYNVDDETVAPGGDGVFAGLILGNERVPSEGGETWYAKGDKIELVEMGRVAVNIDLAINDVARGAAVHFQKDNGKLGAGAGNGTTTITIKNAVITEHGDKAKSPCLALVTLTGPVA
jgi:hypothetical protein